MPGTLLPPELQDLIIDRVAPDSGSLKHCALVCRTWHPRSSLHLFSTISVKSPGAFRALTTLAETNCALFAHTHTLRLHMPGKYTPPEIIKLLHSVPQLRELSLAMFEVAPTSLAALSVALPALCSLRLDCPSLPDCTKVLEMFGASAKQLRLLDLSGLTTDALPVVGRLLSQLGATLAALRIGFVDCIAGITEVAVKEHIALRHLPRLETLSIANLSFHPGYLCSTSYAWVPHVLHQCSAKEVILELGFPPVIGGGFFVPRVSRRVSEHLLDWVPWSECAESLDKDTQVVLDIWPRVMVKEDAVLDAVRRRMHAVNLARPLRLAV
ncbi:hypothetical protein EXIGLDRAFT_726296 [Exidia glandulosa HHB12029]|uniref:F-box domain-containing protein n=1 Tax=Exidia glandulosa HHB12029 TaxID=1314781 RepID=A0A165ZRP3_EXIGL|nr:hypothetical protein EXIGLDRAFT_726296 [Exidia glandulosa HHB12029]